MTTLVELSGAEAREQWDNSLLAFSDCNFQQSYGFGELERSKGMVVHRLQLVQGKQITAMAQVLVRRHALGVRSVIVRGGPVFSGSHKNLGLFLSELISFFDRRHRLWYLNVNLATERSAATELVLREVGLTKPHFERAPYLTYMVSLGKEADELHSGLNPKWRNQLRRAEQYGTQFTWGRDDSLIRQYLGLHNSMCSIKSIERYVLSYEDICRMSAHLGEQMQLLVGTHGGRAVCGCVVVIFGRDAYYYFAAANEEGRKGYLSNSMVWWLIQRLKGEGIKRLDMSGVDPKRNWGGYHFKKGVGGDIFAYMGEWDYCKSCTLKFLANLALYVRSSRLYR